MYLQLYYMFYMQPKKILYSVQPKQTGRLEIHGLDVTSQKNLIQTVYPTDQIQNHFQSLVARAITSRKPYNQDLDFWLRKVSNFFLSVRSFNQRNLDLRIFGDNNSVAAFSTDGRKVTACLLHQGGLRGQSLPTCFAKAIIFKKKNILIGISFQE